MNVDLCEISWLYGHYMKIFYLHEFLKMILVPWLFGNIQY